MALKLGRHLAPRNRLQSLEHELADTQLVGRELEVERSEVRHLKGYAAAVSGVDDRSGEVDHKPDPC